MFAEGFSVALSILAFGFSFWNWYKNSRKETELPRQRKSLYPAKAFKEDFMI